MSRKIRFEETPGNYATYPIKREKMNKIIFKKKMPWYEKWIPVILWMAGPNGENLSQGAESLGSRWVWKRLAHHSEALAFRRPSTKRNKAAGLSAKGKGLQATSWVFPKIGKHPKMDGENNGNPYENG